MPARYTNEKVTQSGVGVTEWVILGDRANGYLGADRCSVDIEAGADATVDVEYTISTALTKDGDVVPAEEIRKFPALTGITAASNGGFTIDATIKAVRLNQTVGANTSNMTVLKVKRGGGE